MNASRSYKNEKVSIETKMKRELLAGQSTR